MSKASKYNRRCGTSIRGAYGCSDADNARLVSKHDVVICTAKAGVQVLNASVLEDARQLKVAADINATPPAGIEGITHKDNGVPTAHAPASTRAVSVGPLTIGKVKAKTQQTLLRSMLDIVTPIYLDFGQAFKTARELA